MAKKDFDNYYYQIQATYLEMSQLLKQLLKQLEDGEIDEDRVENFKMAMLPVSNNYGFITQVKVLLDGPKNKKKKAKWQKQQSKFIKSADIKFSPETIMKENNDSIQRMKDLLD